ncbi:MAG: hypothetical protein A2504_03430 [Bdellovibrionales bacterium RIFOXYD12_FULL_39_22]|nr:MAG: hypothetical protein A2385_15840 [Bdellovibrionales bacterium RIFOXYB1_FULL_39_21]OFZ41576.1 MAG: hypothetical protein A2485_02530 [Bdellovibrionales bacterium RIFOXYC12_FULL_39_17]OFZ45889.1 MAG: hypothetical protein A2404_12895 [Bdellovibrionales bacterium RIFOXYC1_FULL_39_130]OFZ74821.1 MAG: hypothetical protein A2560_10325 [Bdellovibrionales bacterium RIFOXYD1_FULL_39_84]OFZ92681.1 MAG: hypothetical protein A2504_03430 [Bdellovibrionales bacterium RIFOXYD12_FULL_39_22]HLE11270.1 DU
MFSIKKLFLFFIIILILIFSLGAESNIDRQKEMVKFFGLNDKEEKQVDLGRIKTKKSKKDEKKDQKYLAELKGMEGISAASWKLFKQEAINKEQLTLEISYMGLTAGELVLKVTPEEIVADKKVIKASAALKSVSVYKLFFEANDNLESYILKDSFIPLKHTLVQNEKGKKLREIQLFDHDKLTGYFFSDKIEEKKEAKKGTTGQLPKLFQDSLSSIIFLTGLPLKKGDHYKIPIVDKARAKLVSIDVTAGEDMEIAGKKVKTVKLNASGLLSVIKKQRQVTFWFSNDEFHRLVKLEAELNVGMITGKLVRHSK